MTTINLPDLRNGYVWLVSWLLDDGRPVVSRDMPVRELTGVTLQFDDPTGVMLPLGVNRRVNSRLAAVEALQLLSGTGDVELLRRASPSYTDVLVDPAAAAYGAYGPRLSEQLNAVYVELRDRPTSRRAVLAIWRPDDAFHDGDRPCTLSLQFLVRDGKLELHVTMRSQDVWLGVPYDAFMFTQLQWSLAHQLGVDVGKYVHHVGSLHLYVRDFEGAGMLTACPQDRPAPVDYPRGVVVPGGGVADTYNEVANYMLEGTADAFEVDENRWYIRQLTDLGVYQQENA